MIVVCSKNSGRLVWEKNSIYSSTSSLWLFHSNWLYRYSTWINLIYSYSHPASASYINHAISRWCSEWYPATKDTHPLGELIIVLKWWMRTGCSYSILVPEKYPHNKILCFQHDLCSHHGTRQYDTRLQRYVGVCIYCTWWVIFLTNKGWAIHTCMVIPRLRY